MNDVSDRPSWSQLNQRGGWGSGDAAKPASFQLPQPRRSGQQCRTPRANKKQSVLTPPLTPAPQRTRVQQDRTGGCSAPCVAGFLPPTRRKRRNIHSEA